MLIVWYNSESKEYKFGDTIEYHADLSTATDPRAFSILMRLESHSRSMAQRVINQLNITEKKMTQINA